MKDIEILEIRKILKPRAMNQFLKWFRGQTYEINEDGEHIVYGYDFERFLRSHGYDKILKELQEKEK